MKTSILLWPIIERILWVSQYFIFSEAPRVYFSVSSVHFESAFPSTILHRTFSV